MKKTIILLTILLCSLAHGQFWENPNQKPSLFGMRINRGHILGDPVGLWLFNEGSGGQVFDLSGNENIGTLVADTHWVAGKFGPALDFDGTGDYVDLGTSPSVNSGKPFTIIILLYLDSFHVAFPGFFSFTANTSSGFCSFLNTSDAANYAPFSFGSRDGEGWDGFRPSEDFSSSLVGSWNQITITYDGVSPTAVGSFDCYLNDVNKALTTAANFAAHGNVTVFGRQGTTTNYLDGKLSHLILYDRVLSASEIALLYREPFCFMEPSWNWVLWGGISVPTGAGQVIYIY